MKEHLLILWKEGNYKRKKKSVLFCADHLGKERSYVTLPILKCRQSKTKNSDAGVDRATSVTQGVTAEGKVWEVSWGRWTKFNLMIYLDGSLLCSGGTISPEVDPCWTSCGAVDHTFCQILNSWPHSWLATSTARWNIDEFFISLPTL